MTQGDAYSFDMPIQFGLQTHWLDIIKNTIALNGAFPTAEQDTAMRGSAPPPRRRGRRTPQSVRGAEDNYLDAWQNVDSKQGVPLAVARKAFGEDPKPIIEELNEVLVA